MPKEGIALNEDAFSDSAYTSTNRFKTHDHLLVQMCQFVRESLRLANIERTRMLLDSRLVEYRWVSIRQKSVRLCPLAAAGLKAQ